MGGQGHEAGHKKPGFFGRGHDPIRAVSLSPPTWERTGVIGGDGAYCGLAEALLLESGEEQCARITPSHLSNLCGESIKDRDGILQHLITPLVGPLRNAGLEEQHVGLKTPTWIVRSEAIPSHLLPGGVVWETPPVESDLVRCVPHVVGEIWIAGHGQLRSVVPDAQQEPDGRIGVWAPVRGSGDLKAVTNCSIHRVEVIPG